MMSVVWLGQGERNLCIPVGSMDGFVVIPYCAAAVDCACGLGHDVSSGILAGCGTGMKEGYVG